MDKKNRGCEESMDELRIGVKESFKRKLLRSRFKYAGHVERMGDEKLAKRSDAQKVKGKGGEAYREREWEENYEKPQTMEEAGDC